MQEKVEESSNLSPNKSIDLKSLKNRNKYFAIALLTSYRVSLLCPMYLSQVTLSKRFYYIIKIFLSINYFTCTVFSFQIPIKCRVFISFWKFCIFMQNTQRQSDSQEIFICYFTYTTFHFIVPLSTSPSHCIYFCVSFHFMFVFVCIYSVDEIWKGYTKHVPRAMAHQWNGCWIRKLFCTTYCQSCLTWTIVEQLQNNTPIEFYTHTLTTITLTLTNYIFQQYTRIYL